jgi:hypothetical protein
MAIFVITGQLQAGMPTAAIERRHHDMTAWLLANVATAEGQSSMEPGRSKSRAEVPGRTLFQRSRPGCCTGGVRR